MINNDQKLSENLSNTAVVIFGVTGDLTSRKLIPAIYELYQSDRIPNNLHIVGFARREWDDDQLKKIFMDSVRSYSGKEVEEDKIDNIFSNVKYIQSTFSEFEGYKQLGKYLIDEEIQNVLFYLATPPESYETIIQLIGNAKLSHLTEGWTRIVIEKPYGRDLATAKNLDKLVHTVFNENQIYRIDHYLGKETVQNILVLRFANGIFEPLWNRQYVDHIQITVAETVGVGTRAGYYENSGVIRDMFQNHLLQLLALTAMEAPVGFTADCVRDEKVKVLRALKPYDAKGVLDNTFRAQYTSGYIDGKKVIGYKDEDGVARESITETFLAARLFIDNWRWSGVPFYLRSGKRLPKRMTEIAIQFKQIPLSLFNWHNMAGDAPNVLVMKLQPDEGVTLSFGAKRPGHINQISPVEMNFDYEESFDIRIPEAYVRLIQDALYGDATLFTRSDEVTNQWGFINRILDGWKEDPRKYLPVYEAGTWGPPGVDFFIKGDNRHWRNPEV
jgi:glucose-6-phosphate 1-dehydrogenase